jgi:hypothetical protein
MISHGKSDEPGERPPEQEAKRSSSLVRRAFPSAAAAERRLEQLLTERRRELEEHAARFEARVLDLEHREQLLRDERASVERLLRLGIAELERREADLVRLEGQLTDSQALLEKERAELNRRRGELGAVELKRASVEQREQALESREAAVDAREARLDEVAGAARAPQEQAFEPTGPVLLFVPGPTYRLVEHEPASLSAGGTLEVEGEDYVVARIGPSPLPDDPRRCAYLVRGVLRGSEPGGSS